MLRQKLLTRVGLLICAFVLGAVVAIWVLQDVLHDVDTANSDARILMDGIQGVESAVTRIEASRTVELAAGSDIGARPGADDVRQAVSDLDKSMRELAAHPLIRSQAQADRPSADVAGATSAAYGRLAALLPAFVAAYSPPDSGQTVAARDAAGLATRMHAAISELGVSLRQQVAAEQMHVARYFRGIVLVLTLAALAMVNIAVIVLLRTAQMVLRPVGALVEGSRQLAAERFDHRVQVDQGDEFGELARAYNHLAERLQANEERRAETLRQLAVTLNHGLNNAMSIIELQLGLLDRQSGGNPTLRNHLREIRGCLGRMTDIVASLKHIRRVVLTDYAPGQKMVDLERSVENVEVHVPPIGPSPGTRV